MKKNLMFDLAALLLVLSFSSGGKAQNETFWIGKFEHEDSGDFKIEVIESAISEKMVGAVKAKAFATMSKTELRKYFDELNFNRGLSSD